MKSHITLGIHGVLAVMVILVMVAAYDPTYGLREDYAFLSERMCGPNKVSVYRSSLPLYRGGSAEQLNVVCLPRGQPIEQEGLTFPIRNYVYPFDRFNQNPWRGYWD